MKNYPQIVSKVYNEPWLITPDKHASIRKVLESRLDGDTAGSGIEPDGSIPIADEIDCPEPLTFGQTRVIPIYGIIGKHLSYLEMISGGCSLDIVGRWISDAENDSAIESVILDFDSPGGTVTGVPEMAKTIRGLAEKKECTAYSEHLCCSGAYWLAAQASQFYCTESAIIGSIGVYSIYEDWTRWLEKEGIKMNPISAGDYKLAGAWFKPLTDDERAIFQERVDGIYERFKEAVSIRRTIQPEYMHGQIVYGAEAVEVGLVDGLVDDREELLR